MVDIWAKARKAQDIPKGDTWQEDKPKCSDYNADPDNGSGFVIWLDGYNRGKNKTEASVLNSDATLKVFLDACVKQPDALMLDVLAKSAK